VSERPPYLSDVLSVADDSTMKLNSVTKVILATLVPYLYYYLLCKRNVLLRLKLKGKGGLDPATVTTDSKRKRYRIGAPKYFVKSTGESSHRLELDKRISSDDFASSSSKEIGVGGGGKLIIFCSFA